MQVDKCSASLVQDREVGRVEEKIQTGRTESDHSEDREVGEHKTPGEGGSRLEVQSVMN